MVDGPHTANIRDFSYDEVPRLIGTGWYEFVGQQLSLASAVFRFLVETKRAVTVWQALCS